MKKISVVQIGIGHDHASMVLDSMLKQSDIFDVKALALTESENKEFAWKVERLNGRLPIITAEEALGMSGLDGAVIETEEVNLTKYATLATEKGLAVHMDKPGGTDLAEFEKLIRTVKEKNLVFSTGYMYRHNAAINAAIEKAKSGELGKIYSVEAQMNCFHAPEKRQWLSRFEGGMMFFLGCHLVDLILRIQGDPEEIIPMNTCTGLNGVKAEDYGFAVFRYKNGISFAKTCAAEVGGFERRQLVICGEKGTIELRPLERFTDGGVKNITGIRCIPESEKRSWGYIAPFEFSEPFDRYDGMMKAFAEYVRGEKANPFDYDYELKLYRTVLRACGLAVAASI